MNDLQIRDALRAIAAQEIPEMDRWSEIKQKIQPTAQPRRAAWTVMKFGTVIFVITMALISIAVAYAVSQGWGDPGVDSAAQAGFVSDVQVTPAATFAAPTARPTDDTPAISAIVDEVYADTQRVAVSYTLYNLPPEIYDGDGLQSGYTYTNFLYYPGHTGGDFFNSGDHVTDEPGPVPGSLSVHVVLPYNEPISTEQPLDVTLEIGLDHVDEGNNNWLNPFVTFSFDLHLDVQEPTVYEVNETQTVNGLALTLNKVEVTPAGSKVEICFDRPDPLGNWVPRLTMTLNGEQGKTASYSQAPNPLPSVDRTRDCTVTEVSTVYTPDLHQIVVRRHRQRRC